MQQIHYEGEPAAAVLPDRYWLVASIEQLAEDHPTRRWVTALCLYAMRQQELDLPYEPDVAERVARELLMPTAEFLPLYGRDDQDLVEHFSAPRAQVAARKTELALNAVAAVEADLLRRRGG